MLRKGELVLVPHVEGEPSFVKSSYCGAGDCVEVSRVSPDRVAVRHSDDHSQMIEFSVDQWAFFIAGAKAGQFDVDVSR